MSRANVTVVNTRTVKPAGAQAHAGPLYMNALDQIYGLMHSKTIHLYKPDKSQEWVAMVDTLKSSLGLAMARFSPLAGRLRWVADDHRLLEIVCNGEGAELVEAECDVEMSCFQHDTDLESLMPLVPAVDFDERPVEEVPIMLVQVTRFRCGGMALGISTAHAAMDGQSAFHFFSEWSRLARGEQMEDTPWLDRTIFRARERPNNGRQLSFSDHIEFQSLPFLLGKKDGAEERKKETVKLALPLTKAQLDTLKKVASSSINNNNGGISHGFSRYEVVAAHIWRCACKARGHEYEQPTAVSIAMNVRNRIHSIPLPHTYFGNMILVMNAISQAGQLISNPLGYACGKLREAINKVDEDYIWSNFELLEKHEDVSIYKQGISASSKTTKESKSFYGNPNLRVASWLSLPVHGMDFGWGNKIDTIPVARSLDGLSILLPGPDNDGSIMVVLCLQVAHVGEFKKQFYQDLLN